jgi:hypothetical protein
MRSVVTHQVDFVSPLNSAGLQLIAVHLTGSMTFNDTQTAFWKTHTRPEVSKKVQKLVMLSTIAYDRDLTKAAKWCKKAADQGHCDAQFNLGLAYYKGEGVNKNFDNAIHYFSMASNQNHILASFNLGAMYFTGDGPDKDLSKAAHWFQVAAEGGLKKAQLALAEIIILSEKDNRDLYKATYWLLRSGLTDDKKTIKISLVDFSDLIALIPSTLLENKEFEKVNSLEFLKIPADARGKMGQIFAELMQANPNLTSLNKVSQVRQSGT